MMISKGWTNPNQHMVNCELGYKKY